MPTRRTRSCSVRPTCFSQSSGRSRRTSRLILPDRPGSAHAADVAEVLEGARAQLVERGSIALASLGVAHGIPPKQVDELRADLDEASVAVEAALHALDPARFSSEIGILGDPDERIARASEHEANLLVTDGIRYWNPRGPDCSFPTLPGQGERQLPLRLSHGRRACGSTVSERPTIVAAMFGI